MSKEIHVSSTPKLQRQNELDVQRAQKTPKVRKASSGDSAIGKSPLPEENGETNPGHACFFRANQTGTGTMNNERNDHFSLQPDETGLVSGDGDSGHCEPSSPFLISMSVFNNVKREMLKERQLSCDLEEQNTDLKKKNTDLEEQIIVLRKYIKITEGSKQSLETENRRLQQKIEQLNTVSRRCDNLTAILNDERARFQRDMNAIKERLNEKSVCCDNLTAMLTDERARFEQEMDTIKEQHENDVCLLNIKIDKLSEKKAELEDQLNRCLNSLVISEGTLPQVVPHQPEEQAEQPQQESYIGQPQQESYIDQPQEFHNGQPHQESHIGQPQQESYIGQPQEFHNGQPHQESHIGQPQQESYIGQPQQESHIGQPHQESQIGQPHLESSVGDPSVVSRVQYPRWP